MLKWFICPDGEKCEVGACLSECRTGMRCNPPSVLAVKADQRDYPEDLKDYNPSVTELLNEPWQKYLEIVNDYAKSPYELNWAIRGTAMHARMEAQDVLHELSEERYPMIIGDRIISHGKYDAIDVVDGTLWDYKTYGTTSMSIKLNKPFEEGFYEPIWQMNGYLKIINDALPGLEIRSLKLYINSPDINKTSYEEALSKWKNEEPYKSGPNKGLPWKEPIHPEYVIDIPIKTAEEVESMFLYLRHRWDKCIETKGASEDYQCANTWGDRRCSTWCGVSDLCPYWERRKREKS